jgi:Uncharacterized protein conserved in bacteria
LDTHMLIWALNGDPKMSKDIRPHITEVLKDNLPVYFSHVSLLEMALLFSRRKLLYGSPLLKYGEMLQSLYKDALDVGFQPLRLSLVHLQALADLPYPPSGHRDPFDRLLVAQALTVNLHLVSKDQALSVYFQTTPLRLLGQTENNYPSASRPTIRRARKAAATSAISRNTLSSSNTGR